MTQDPTKDIKIGLFGLGTVGCGLWTILQNTRNAHATLHRICVRDIDKPRPVDVDRRLLTDRPEDILDDPETNMIVEVIDDAEASYRIVSEAMRKEHPGGNAATRLCSPAICPNS